MDAAQKTLQSNFKAEARLGWLIPALVLMIVAAFSIFALTVDWSDTRLYFQDVYMLPWIGLAAGVIVAPSIYLLRRQQFNPTHPLAFAAWSFFLPAFVVGGLFLASGRVQPYFLYFIDDPEYTFPLTFVYIALGFAGLTAGFFLPFAKKIGTAIEKRLPVADWQPSSALVPSVALLGAGIVFFFLAWLAGTVGYQHLNLADSFGGLQYSLSLFSMEGSFLLWLACFRSRRLNVAHYIAIAIFIAATLIRLTLAGSKSSLIHSVIAILLAYMLSGKIFKIQHGFIFGAIGILALILGMVYGVTFRNIKGSEERTSLEEYLKTVSATYDQMGKEDLTKTVGDGFSTLAERIEVTSSLAVVVANYEKLAPYEAVYGIENNIWTYTWTAFIPRFIWTDKPIVSDARTYSELYFSYGENSFAITPMGDLLRNYGPLGIPLGMLLLGFLLRVIYVALIENQTVTLGRATAYYMLLTSISYEGFYGTILPSMLRVGLVTAVSLLLINALIQTRRTRI